MFSVGRVELHFKETYYLTVILWFVVAGDRLRVREAGQGTDVDAVRNARIPRSGDHPFQGNVAAVWGHRHGEVVGTTTLCSQKAPL